MEVNSAEAVAGWVTAETFPRFSAVRQHRWHLAPAPDVEVVEREFVITLTAPVQTVPPDRLRVLVEPHRVTIRAEPVTPPPEGVPPWETPASGFERVICSHAALDADAARVTVRNGVLEILVPKAEPGGEGVYVIRGD